MEDREPSRYLIKSLVRASQVISAFHSEDEALRLRDLVTRTGFTKMTCYRLVFTLHQCGLLEKVAENRYRLGFSVRPQRKYTIGYASHGLDASFPKEVEDSLTGAAERARIKLIVVNNRYDGRMGIRNADRLVRERVDLAIVFQADELTAPAIARRFLDAQIPLIAIDIPHPGATYFGADNYRAGLMAGRHLGQWANKYWGGAADEIVLLEVARAGSVPQTRIRGMLVGVQETMRDLDHCRLIHLDGDGAFGRSQECIRAHLRVSKAERILVGAATDPSAIGALRAFEEAGRLTHCAVVGQNADREGRAEIRKANTTFIGSVAFFPESYGDGVIRLALDILARKPTPPAVFMRHQLITRDNVDHVYPNDSLLGI
ncbi:MAG TPA: substrate-binding domain-containing protein [Bryobacteraceae bacterium]|nr:substrate-binding domain-containing protein [Bryobacteraceae bacterium]